AQHIAEVCGRHGVAVPAAALQFPLAHPAITTVLVGSRNAGEVVENATLSDVPLPAQLWADLRDAGLIRPDAPVPSSPR
ncbi:MAG: D-threo-aldose 1-dehydrogenase, partial [Actinomycetota bacterium]|nr:D-threo-aldose 1-dehydrogenase [Actinomycetota bacterium]